MQPSDKVSSAFVKVTLDVVNSEGQVQSISAVELSLHSIFDGEPGHTLSEVYGWSTKALKEVKRSWENHHAKEEFLDRHKVPAQVPDTF